QQGGADSNGVVLRARHQLIDDEHDNWLMTQGLQPVFRCRPSEGAIRLPARSWARVESHSFRTTIGWSSARTRDTLRTWWSSNGITSSEHTTRKGNGSECSTSCGAHVHLRRGGAPDSAAGTR